MIANTSAMRRLKRETAQAFRPQQRIAPDVWIESRVKMSEAFEAARGSYDLTLRPWWREPLQMAGMVTTSAIRIKASPQVGKTLALCALLLYLAEQSPASAMVVLPDRDSAVEFRDRLYALASESGVRIPTKWRWNVRHCDIGDMRVYLAWPRSRQRMRGRRCKYVFRSEIDVYESQKRIGDPIEQSNQRVRGFARHLILDESSPVAEPSRIDGLEQESDRRRWWARCPHCGKWQEVKFFPGSDGRGGVVGLTGEDGNFLEPDAAAQRAHYLCLDGCRIGNEDKSRFMLSGAWVPKGQSVDELGRLVGEANRDTSAVGYHLWAAMGGDSWSAMASQYVRNRAQGMLADAFQNLLGLSFKSRSKMPTWQELGQRLAGTHARGMIPPAVWFLTAGADVQEREVYVTVRGWGDQRTSWLVDWYVFERGDDDEGELIKTDLGQITEAVLARSWPMAGGATNPRGKQSLRVVLLAIDANHRTLDVHNWIRSLGVTKRVRAVRGDAGVRPTDRYKMTTVAHSKRDRSVTYEGGLELWGINPDTFRVDLAQRFRSNPARPGAWYVTADALTEGEWYLRQVVNEPQVIERRKDGRTAVAWKERDRTVGHDYWDCEVYASAAAQMVVDQFHGSPGWDASKWPRGTVAADVARETESPKIHREFA